MLTKKEKANLVEELAKDFKNSKSFLFTTYQNLKVSKLDTLRQSLRKEGCRYKVVKKTLIKLALDKSGFKDFNLEKIGAANGLVLGLEKEMEPIKIVYSFIKENPELKVQFGFFDDKFITSEEIKVLSKLPGKDQLLLELIFTLKSSLSRLQNVLKYNLISLLHIFSEIRSQ